MFVSVLAFAAATAASPQASVPAPAPAAPAAKPRKICRSEALIGSITPKRVCTIVPPRDADAQKQQAPADSSSTPAAPATGTSAER